MVEEEIILLEEQLATANAQVAALEERLAEAEALAATQGAVAADLRRELATLKAALAEHETSALARDSEVTGMRHRLQEVENALAAAAGRYRDLVLRLEPDVPAELVSGATVEEVEASLAQAKETVARVRERIESQAQALRVPPGAPARATPDLGGLTPAEKIRLGLREA